MPCSVALLRERESLLRSDLYRRLDRASSGELILLRAGAGMGKSTIVGSWIRDSGLVEKTTWLSVDPTRHSGAVFWPRLREQISHRVDAEIAPSPRVILDELASASGKRFLVIDGIEHLDDDVLEGLVWLASNATDLTLIVCSRSITLLDAAGLVDRIERTTLEAKDLIFTLDETHTLAHQLGAKLTDVEVSILHSMAGGWPLGIRSALMEGVRSNSCFETARLQIVRLAQELLSGLSSAEQQVLSSVSATSEISLGLATEAAGLDENDVHLALVNAEAHGVLTRQLDGPETIYVIMPALRIELERRADLEPQSERQKQIDRTLARLIREGRLPAAAALCLRDGRLDSARELIVTNWDLFLGIHSDVLDEALEQVSRSNMSLDPVLDFFAASRRLPMHMATSHTVDPVYRRLHEASSVHRGDIKPLYDCLKMIALRELGHFREALLRSLRFMNKFSEDFASPIYASFSPWVWMQHAVTLADCGRTELAIRALEVASCGQGASVAPVTAVLARNRLMVLLLGSGNIRESSQMRQSRDAIAAAVPWEMRSAIADQSRVVDAWLAAERLRLEEGRHLLGRPGDYATQSGPTGLTVLVDALITLYSEQGVSLFDLLHDAIVEGPLSIQHAPTLKSMVTAALCDLLLADGRRTQAEMVARRVSTRRAAGVVTHARVALCNNELTRARDLCDRGKRRSDVTPRILAELSLIFAASEIAVGRLDVALTELRRAFALYDRDGVATPFLLMPKDVFQPILALLVDEPPVHVALVSSGILPKLTSPVHLTKRELVVLDALRRHASVQRIADLLHVSPNTVKTQLRSVYKKLGVVSREDALTIAFEQGLSSMRDDDVQSWSA